MSSTENLGWMSSFIRKPKRTKQKTKIPIKWSLYRIVVVFLYMARYILSVRQDTKYCKPELFSTVFSFTSPSFFYANALTSRPPTRGARGMSPTPLFQSAIHFIAEKFSIRLISNSLLYLASIYVLPFHKIMHR